MRKSQVTALIRALSYGDEEFDELADELYAYKRTVYIETLEDLADGHGFDVHDDITLSTEINEALGADAERQARRIIDTYNREVSEFVRERAAKTPAETVDEFEDWSTTRAEQKAPVIAVTEAYAAHADATAGFYQDNGLDPDFDFGGHGDAPPKCPICRALLEHGPHPLQRVLEIGQPHVRCAQQWHARINDDQLPDDLVLGQNAPAGILGPDTLLERAGGWDQAVNAITSPTPE